MILSAGGTGGHLFPAMSLAATLSDWDILFAAGGLKTNRYFDRTKFAHEEVECATFSLKHPLQVLLGGGKICRGIYQSRALLRRFSPDLVVGFGSFCTLPLLVAAMIEGVPFVLHEQNTVPGKVNRLFSPFAHTMTITFPSTRAYLKKKAAHRAIEVVFPLRTGDRPSQESCWEYFGLRPGLPTLLIFGGSQGAARLNRLIQEALPSLPAIQVIHCTGNNEAAYEAKKAYDAYRIPACVKAFEPHMERAMHISDCALTRAGAATISELIEYELPALLIPYPFATDHHQEKNGEHFGLHVKGGKMYKESDLS
ncbi:MAG: UDP-N-acetylglucosamine--N-acetylmuramyl-(pentapeptide) pyrophosphoryl-undecaprenol N-acetylglucosamine transferase, partial [Chlamydiia bacterium]|nr:UDP-N-acetylglucosamine--N-acetylmuramyl-(pentapeptide) pyrophosphoryl-undecaprenol N-acetylglucosamine transferase [Chlamydiia bacterium]